jgi:hypothetical protein
MRWTQAKNEANRRSRAMRNLKATLGVPLFDHSARQMRLTWVRLSVPAEGDELAS